MNTGTDAPTALPVGPAEQAAPLKGDIVNNFFRQFYPPDWRDHWEPTALSGRYGRRYTGADKTGAHIFPSMRFADGTSLSVQGHCGAYSYPCDDFAEEYLQVEIMGPIGFDELLAPYEEECNGVGSDQMIYPYVPVHVVIALIKKRGGLVVGA